MDHQFPHHVCRLHKSLYGLKQAPRAWFDRFASQLLHLGFEASMADSSLFVYHSRQIIIYLLVYVDDIIITGNSSSQVSHLVTALSQAFELKDLGALSYFLGIQILPTRFGLTLCQSKYASDVLHTTWKIPSPQKLLAALMCVLPLLMVLFYLIPLNIGAWWVLSNT